MAEIVEQPRTQFVDFRPQNIQENAPQHQISAVKLIVKCHKRSKKDNILSKKLVKSVGKDQNRLKSERQKIMKIIALLRWLDALGPYLPHTPHALGFPTCV